MRRAPHSPSAPTLALAATAATTAAMAWPAAPLWLALRFAAGVASAWVFVATSVWCLGALARLARTDLSGIVYAGVGCGIALTGLYCLGAGAWALPASALWWHLGVLALLLALPAVATSLRVGHAPALDGAAAAAAAKSATSAAPGTSATAATSANRSSPAATAMPAAPAARAASDDPAASSQPTRGLVACYGLMGFGYILPATFLPALARGVADDPRLFGLAWPVFGATAALSTVLAGWWMRRATRLQVWAACQGLMGAGVLLPSLWVSGLTIALSALLVGGTFMVITLAGVQEMRARVPQQAARGVGRITAAFACGQIAGPVLSALLLQWPALAECGLALALQAGALGLFASGVWLARRAWPAKASVETPHA